MAGRGTSTSNAARNPGAPGERTGSFLAFEPRRPAPAHGMALQVAARSGNDDPAKAPGLPRARSPEPPQKTHSCLGPETNRDHTSGRERHGIPGEPIRFSKYPPHHPWLATRHQYCASRVGARQFHYTNARRFCDRPSARASEDSPPLPLSAPMGARGFYTRAHDVSSGER